MGDWYQHGIRIGNVPVDDRATQYGDGVFETIAVRDAEPRFWDLHVARLALDCEKIGLAMPPPSILLRDLENALARTTIHTGFCAAKIVISCGGDERGYRRAENLPANSRIGIFADEPLSEDDYASGVCVHLCETIVASQPKLAGVKSLNRLDQVLARLEWSEAGIFDGLMCDDDGNLICATRANLFVVRENVIETPRLDRCGVAGIMRKCIINLLGENNIDVMEMAIGSDEFASFDEIFLSNSQFGVVPVRRCGDHTWAVGEATRSVMALLSYNDVPECRS